MPLNKDAYSRYRLIDERLRRKPHPTLEQLQQYVGEKLGRALPKRTLQLDLQEMRYNQSLQFEAPIAYNRSTRTYHYEDPEYSIKNLPVTADDLHGLDFAIGILDQFKELPAIREFEDAIKKIADTVRYNREQQGEEKIIQFDRPNSYRGIEFMDAIVRAIRERRRIRLIYRRFDDASEKEHVIEPYLVREFRSRFYLIGNAVSAKGDKVLTFAFDRIVDVFLTEKTFDGKKFDAERFYKTVFGITAGQGEAEKIVLSFTPAQGKYVLSQPLHHSQQVVKETKTETRLSLHVAVNTELVMQLLSYGAQVKVLKPASLAERMKREAELLMERYQTG
ncbi:MAG: WYL domain-containing protein [Chitinophagales bacterium]